MSLLSRPARISASPSLGGLRCGRQVRYLWRAPKGKDQRSKYGQKLESAKKDWEAKAAEIRRGDKESMLSFLKSRGYINAIAGEDSELDELLTSKRIGAYVGIDPTAPSLHVGNLLPFMPLFWMYVNGYKAITVLGGATAAVGDPTGRTTTREAVHSSVRTANMAKMHLQLKKLWTNMEFHAIHKYGYTKEWAWERGLVNNNQWMNNLTLREFLRTIGTGSRVGTMLGRDTARTKMEKGDGLSVAEFMYPLLQGWDWWQLFQQRGVNIQIGGADQFGNIVAGMDAVSYLIKHHGEQLHPDLVGLKPTGFTVPLLTTAGGEKFGKSAGNAIWLDSEMTSPYELYQFFLRSADADVAKYLSLFTLIPNNEIDKIVAQHDQDPSKRVGQRRLAREFLELVHGVTIADQVETEVGLLFRRPKAPSAAKGLEEGSKALNPSVDPNAPQTNSFNAPSPNCVLPRSLIENKSFPRVLYAAGLVSSRSEGQRLAANGGAYVGSRSGNVGGMDGELSYKPLTVMDPGLTWQYVIDDKLLILRVGKWKVKVVDIISDEEFDRRGLDAPGWSENKEGGTSGGLSKESRMQKATANRS